MQYAQLIDGAPVYAPNPIRVDGRDIFTTDPTPYGYKPVVAPEPPTREGYTAVPDGWEETETAIRQLWRLEPSLVADGNVPKGQYFQAGGGMYLSAVSIAVGEAILPGDNCTEVSTAEALNALNE